MYLRSIHTWPKVTPILLASFGDLVGKLGNLSLGRISTIRLA